MEKEIKIRLPKDDWGSEKGEIDGKEASREELKKFLKELERKL